MGVDRTIAFFEGIEKLAEKYSQFISTIEVKEIQKDTWYIMFHFEYIDGKLGGIYERVHLSTIGYGLLEGFEMALKQIQYRLRRMKTKGKKKLEELGLKRHGDNFWTVQNDDLRHGIIGACTGAHQYVKNADGLKYCEVCGFVSPHLYD
jgi:hypothetical protein